jgi:hypothetical protein
MLASCKKIEKGNPAGNLRFEVLDSAELAQIDISERPGVVEIVEPDLVNNSLILINDGSKSNRVYLMNKNGIIEHEWQLNRRLGKDAQLLPSGELLAVMMVDSTDIGFGGQAGIIQRIGPGSSVEWEFSYAADSYITHHDAEILPNGNIITLVWEQLPKTTALQAGSKMDLDIYTEAIIEIDPNTNDIVWEWHASDHLVQEYDETKDNYGQIAAHPERIDINYVTGRKGDIMHANGIAYDAKRDLIYITVNWYSEVWVIDHSTSAKEAAANTGGNYGKGGDLIYRFGNPRAYANEHGEVLFNLVHSPIFIGNGQDTYTKMLVFSNNLPGKDQSAIYEIALEEELELIPNADNEPEITWFYSHPELHSDKISSAVREANGNTLITEGDFGLWEITPDKKVVWKFKGEGSFFWRSYSFERNNEAINNLFARIDNPH